MISSLPMQVKEAKEITRIPIILKGQVSRKKHHILSSTTPASRKVNQLFYSSVKKLPNFWQVYSNLGSAYFLNHKKTSSQ